MRINVYAEEVTDDVEIVTKTVTPDGWDTPVTFYGVRMYLKSAPELHHNADDDDRSAITFWIKWTHANGNDDRPLRKLWSAMGLATHNALNAEKLTP